MKQASGMAQAMRSVRRTALFAAILALVVVHSLLLRVLVLAWGESSDYCASCSAPAVSLWTPFFLLPEVALVGTIVVGVAYRWTITTAMWRAVVTMLLGLVAISAVARFDIGVMEHTQTWLVLPWR